MLFGRHRCSIDVVSRRVPTGRRATLESRAGLAGRVRLEGHPGPGSVPLNRCVVHVQNGPELIEADPAKTANAWLTRIRIAGQARYGECTDSYNILLIRRVM